MSAPPQGKPLVVAAGLAVVDVIQRVDALPGPNQKTWSRAGELDVGGPAANAARTAAKLGVDVILAAGIGRQGLGWWLAQALEADDVQVTDVAVGHYTPGISTVLISGNGDRAVVTTPAVWDGGAQRLALGRLLGADAVLVDGHLMGQALDLASAAKDKGVPVVFDGGSWKPGTPALLGSVDVAICSSDFVVPDLGDAASTEEVLDWVAGRGARWAVQTAGADPVTVRAPDGRFTTLEVEEVPADRVVDTLGAGDVFHGVVAACLATAHHRGVVLDDQVVGIALSLAVSHARGSVMHPGALGWAGAQESLAWLELPFGTGR
jgi:sugar/nucleoside kinase (ribokinase family)